jgi:hypothetical protein
LGKVRLLRKNPGLPNPDRKLTKEKPGKITKRPVKTEALKMGSTALVKESGGN